MSIMTASLSNLLVWTKGEDSAHAIIVRETMRARVEVLAAKLIQRWWKKIKRQEPPFLDEEDEEEWLDELRRKKSKCSSLDLDSVPGTSLKMDLINRNFTLLEADLALISFDLSRSELQIGSGGDRESLQSDFRTEAYQANHAALTAFMEEVGDASLPAKFEANALKLFGNQEEKGTS